MKHIVQIGEENIEFTLVKSLKTKRLRITVYHDGEIKVTCPLITRENSIRQFVINKSSWIFKKVSYFKSRPRIIITQGTSKEYLENKEKTRVFVRERLEYFNAVYNFSWKKVAIKNLKSRWGSCSSKGNLNFSYKLSLLPKELADYIVVHELCHLKEMNHSLKFWNLVSKTIPDYKVLRLRLKGIQ